MGATSEPPMRSFLEVSAESPFSIQNLPYGVFRPVPGAPPRVGVAIGDWVLDLAVLERRGLLVVERASARQPAGDEPPDTVFDQPALNRFMRLGRGAWQQVRGRITRLLSAGEPTLRDDADLRKAALHPRAAVQLELPCAIGDYTDFYASRAHAENAGRIFRGPAAALPPNWLHLPIAYHGRSSSIVVSGTGICRPCGQFREEGAGAPECGPTRELDFELEVGLLIGPGNPLGHPLSVQEAAAQIFGFVLVNDWSARDIQQWEYVPLGPFLGKNFATTVSPWVVPAEALEPFRRPLPAQEPPPPTYLRPPAGEVLRTYDIEVEVALQPARADAAAVISRTNYAELYWSPEQMLAHHTVGGCNLRPGDLLASGTVSGRGPGAQGCLLELTERARRPLRLPGGETRGFLEDGDTVILSGWCTGPDYRVGFGECRGTIRPAARSTGG
jgi:fumarylacetoacetase